MVLILLKWLGVLAFTKNPILRSINTIEKKKK